MKIELKNIKINHSFSEETLCYTGVVYINGKKAGFVKNDGHGGCSHVHADDRELVSQADKYFADQPAKDVRYGDRDEDVLKDFKETLDSYLDNLAYDHSNAKEAAKVAKKEAKIKDNNAKAGFPFTFKIVKGMTNHYIGVKSMEQKAKIAGDYKVDESKITAL